jgi:hypothetical protein
MKAHQSNDPIVAFGRAYLSAPIPDLFHFREVLDHVEQQLKLDTPDYARLYGLADALTSTMSFRASTADVCEFILHERREQMERILVLAAEANPKEALRILREIIRGAYAAIDFTRDGRPGQAVYQRIEKWSYDATESESSIAEFRSILGEVLADVARAAKYREEA